MSRGRCVSFYSATGQDLDYRKCLLGLIKALLDEGQNLMAIVMGHRLRHQKVFDARPLESILAVGAGREGTGLQLIKYVLAAGPAIWLLPGRDIHISDDAPDRVPETWNVSKILGASSFGFYVWAFAIASDLILKDAVGAALEEGYAFGAFGFNGREEAAFFEAVFEVSGKFEKRLPPITGPL